MLMVMAELISHWMASRVGMGFPAIVKHEFWVRPEQVMVLLMGRAGMVSVISWGEEMGIVTPPPQVLLPGSKPTCAPRCRVLQNKSSLASGPMVSWTL